MHSICKHIWKTQQWLQDSRWSVFMPTPGVRQPMGSQRVRYDWATECRHKDTYPESVLNVIPLAPLLQSDSISWKHQGPVHLLVLLLFRTHFPRFLLDSPHTYMCPLPKDTIAENTISNSLPSSNLALLYFSLKYVLTRKICLPASFLLLQLECKTLGGKEFVCRLPWWHPRRPVQHMVDA